MRFILLLVHALALQGCRDNRDSQQQPPAPHHPAILSPSAPAATARLMDGMGKVDFPITTSSKDAQAFFNQGVAQLYGFWFVEAERIGELPWRHPALSSPHINSH